MAERESLRFGLRDIPEGVASAWGFRWIWPDDVVWNRQASFGPEDERGRLQAWLNGGALRSARDEARRMARGYELAGSEDREVTLFEDETGVVKANPQGSYGYLYVAAWLK